MRLDGHAAIGVMKLVCVFAAVLAGVLLLEGMSGGKLYSFLFQLSHPLVRPDLVPVRISIATYVLMVIFWPVIMFAEAKGWRWPGLILGLCLIVTPILLSANAVTLALIVATAGFFASKLWPRNFWPMSWIMAGAVALFILIFPVAIYWGHDWGTIDRIAPHLPESWADRIGIWDRAIGRIVHAPWIGHGFDTSRHFDPVNLHTHNLSLQVLQELGLVGLVLLAGFWGSVFWRIGADRSEPVVFHEFYSVDSPRYFVASALSYLVFAALSFGIWQEWFLALAAFGASLCLVSRRAIEALAEKDSAPVSKEIVLNTTTIT